MERSSKADHKTIPTDCHHPGYQLLSARSWWCDACMSDCFDDCAREYRCDELRSPFPISAKAWFSHLAEGIAEDLLEFWLWFKPVCVFIVGGVLSALFIVVAYYTRGKGPENYHLTPDGERLFNHEYRCLDIKRQNRLYWIEVWKGELADARDRQDWSAVNDYENLLAAHYDDLDDATHKLNDMDSNWPHIKFNPPHFSTLLPVSMLSSDQH